jgi:glycosyltransferase involved in cell wall biosynthesis
MTTASLVHVVVPVYNARDWLAESLGSIARQDMDPARLEVVVVDDGSSDGSADVAESILKEGAIPYQVIRTGNGGPAQARNIGWQSGRGDWVQFLDADDWLHPGKISRQMHAAGSASPEVAVMYSPWQRVERRKGAWQPSDPPARPVLEPDPPARLLTAEHFVQLGSALFRRTWLERVGGFTADCSPIEDVNLMLRIALAGGQFLAIPSEEPLAYYRQVPDSFSRWSDHRFVEGCVGNARIAEDHWRREGSLNPARAGILAEVYLQGARFFAGIDWLRFEALACRLDALVPGFVPSRPPALRWVSRLLGYRRAERVAVLYRRCKRRLLHPCAQIGSPCSGSLPPCGGGLGTGVTLQATHPPPQPSPTRGEGEKAADPRTVI